MHGARRLDEAYDAYRAMLRRNPANPVALNGLGGIAEHRKDEAGAINFYRRAVTANPRYFEAHHNLARMLHRSHHLAAAVTAASRALELQPADPGAHRLLSSIHMSARRPDLALEALRRALELEPDNLVTLRALVGAKRAACDWSDLDADDRALRQAAASGVPTNPFSLLSTQADLAEQKACAVAWARKLELPPEQRLPARAARRPGPIRLGYLSGDFHDHATSYLTAELFERHDRARFEVRGYSYGPPSDGEVRDRLVAGFDYFTELRDLSSLNAARAIWADDVDILIDLKGYTDRARPEILAHRPARIQVNYLGFPGTMGASFMDYLIADAFTAPPGTEAYCTEQLVRLPDCFQPHDSRRAVASTTPTRASLGLPADGLVFCAFNAAYKLTPALFAIWMRLLAQAPGSVLWLLRQSDLQEANLRREAGALGVASERLVFAARAPQAQHIARLAAADLFLDTLPVGAFTTASDALWAGLPVLTCAGSTPAGRGAGSLLLAAGLPELVTTSLGDYERLALALVQEPGRLDGLRQRLVAARLTAPLFDVPRFVGNLEAAYLAMLGG